MGTEFTEFAGWGMEDFLLWLRVNYPEPPAHKGASWVFVLRFHHIAHGKKGPVIQSTVSGTYKDCIRELAAELARYVGEPSAKIDIHMSLEDRRS